MSNASIDVNNLVASLPVNVQDAIRALVAQEIAKNAPPPPRELTPHEQIEQHLSLARDSLQHAGNTIFFQDRVLSALEMLAAVTFPEEKVSAETVAIQTGGAV